MEFSLHDRVAPSREVLDMQRFVKQSLAATATSLLLSALALLFAQGRLFPQAFADSRLARPIGDSCFILSLPGVMVAVAIWGYSSGRRLLSDMLIVAVNGALYAVPLIFLAALRYWRRRGTARKESA